MMKMFGQKTKMKSNWPDDEKAHERKPTRNKKTTRILFALVSIYRG